RSSLTRPFYRPDARSSDWGFGGRIGAPIPATAGWLPAGPAAATAATATATAAAGGLGALDLNGPAVNRRAVELADGLLGVLGRRHFDEAEAARTARVAVGHDRRGLDTTGRGEDLTQTLVGGGE